MKRVAKGEGQKAEERTIAMKKMDSYPEDIRSTVDIEQGSGFRVQGSGFSGQHNSSFNIHYSSFILHPSSLIPHPMQKPGNKLPGPRRGVLLLLVLGILALFALVAVAFVIISGQSQRSAKTMQRVDQTLDDPQKQLNEAMMQVARGPSNPVSVLGLHSLLEDMYGNTARMAVIPYNPNNPLGLLYYPFNPAPPIGSPITTPPVQAVCGGQLVQIMVPMQTVSPNTFQAPAGTLLGQPYSLPGSFASYNGLVVTFLNGPRTKGHSTRIVSYLPGRTSSSGTVLDQPDFFQIVATDKINFTTIAADMADLATAAIPEQLYYIINGTPFSGTGFGFNPATGALDLKYVLDLSNPNILYQQCLATDPTKLPLTSGASTFASALLPNMPFTAYSSSPDTLIQNPQGNPPGGANEDYDAADYQNMVLGARSPVPAATSPALYLRCTGRRWRIIGSIN